MSFGTELSWACSCRKKQGRRPLCRPHLPVHRNPPVRGV